jgi:hypothetical protein
MTGQEPPGPTWARFLPPSPHREAILSWFERGRASLIERGPGDVPLVEFEDGGVIELDKVRCDKRGQFERADAADLPPESAYRLTKYTDVCTSVDELKRAFAEEPGLAERDPAALLSLLDDALYMIGRMYRRQSEYTGFLEQLEALCRDMRGIGVVDRAPADEAVLRLKSVIEDAPTSIPEQLERLNAIAEQVRAVAQAQEDRLREQKAMAVQALLAYRAVKGGRDWSADEGTPAL